jgi:predicted metal-dependent hydrolase
VTAPPDRPVSGAPGAPPLLLPAEPFPPYRFVPGHAPHPFQPGGYAAGERPAPPPYVPLERWRESRPWLRGLDFFNRGWWWEAHESWESLWHVCEGRDPAQHELLKGLIQLAACALNRERGADAGAARLLDSACEALERARAAAGGAHELGGLHLAALEREARAKLGGPAARIDGFWLRPA